MANVIGQSENPDVAGVYGEGDGVGVRGKSKTWVGVIGETESSNDGGVGVRGICEVGVGLHGVSSKGGIGVQGDSNWVGIKGVTTTLTGKGVWGVHKAGGSAVVGESPEQGGIGIHGAGAYLAGFFEGNFEVTGDSFFKGNVEVTGDISLPNADCAEDFNIGTDLAVEPGTVMVLGEEGVLLPSQKAYDKRVAGVVSGAGSYKPGIVLDKQPSAGLRQPIALLGKVFCKVDARYGAVEVGDLLTTSHTSGHAMKADDAFKAFGTVIGKALRPLAEGRGLIPILISLQ